MSPLLLAWCVPRSGPTDFRPRSAPNPQKGFHVHVGRTNGAARRGGRPGRRDQAFVTGSSPYSCMARLRRKSRAKTRQHAPVSPAREASTRRRLGPLSRVAALIDERRTRIRSRITVDSRSTNDAANRCRRRLLRAAGPSSPQYGSRRPPGMKRRTRCAPRWPVGCWVSFDHDVAACHRPLAIPHPSRSIAWTFVTSPTACHARAPGRARGQREDLQGPLGGRVPSLGHQPGRQGSPWSSCGGMWRRRPDSNR